MTDPIPQKVLIDYFNKVNHTTDDVILLRVNDTDRYEIVSKTELFMRTAMDTIQSALASLVGSDRKPIYSEVSEGEICDGMEKLLGVIEKDQMIASSKNGSFIAIGDAADKRGEEVDWSHVIKEVRWSLWEETEFKSGTERKELLQGMMRWSTSHQMPPLKGRVQKLEARCSVRIGDEKIIDSAKGHGYIIPNTGAKTRKDLGS